MGHYEAAADILQKFCEIISDQAYCFANLAICLSKQGNKNEALAAIEQAIKLKPKDEKLKYNREQIKMGTIEELKSGETILME
jgi:tetratricopeptide (TPR) repeat protein